MPNLIQSPLPSEQVLQLRQWLSQPPAQSLRRVLASQRLLDQFNAGEAISKDPHSGDGAFKATPHAIRASNYGFVLSLLDAILNESDDTFPLETVSVVV